MDIRDRIKLHKYMAYSFLYLAKANRLNGHTGLAVQYKGTPGSIWPIIIA